MRIIDIIEGTTVDGPGLRTSIYFAGCAHKCPGCHNRQTWDFGGGAATTASQVMERVLAADFNVTLTGGDPLYQAAKLLPLVKSITEAGYTIWCYTGFEWADIIVNHDMAALLPFIQVVVDGPYIESQRDPDLLFRGSANQRLIDVRASLDASDIVLWHRD